MRAAPWTRPRRRSPRARTPHTYAGFGDQTQVLTATISANARNGAYTNATKFAVTQTDLQDTQLTSLSDLAASLKKAVGDAVANNDASSLMMQAQSIFDQASAILNSKDANGDYIYGGGKTDVAPVTRGSLAALQALPAVAGAFANGDLKKSVQVADGVTVNYGVTASDVATGLMQALKDIADFDAGPTGNFSAATNLTAAQNNFLTSTIGQVTTVATNLNASTAANGYVSNRLTRRPGPAGLDEHALQGLYFQHPGHQHGQGGHPAVAEPDPAAGGAAGDGGPAPAVAAELPAGHRHRLRPVNPGFLALSAGWSYSTGRMSLTLKPGTRVVAAMSGGVDSSVTAALLKRQGYDVVGITLQLYPEDKTPARKGACCAGADIYDAKRVAESLGIPHYVLDYESRFRKHVIEDFADSLCPGRDADSLRALQ